MVVGQELVSREGCSLLPIGGAGSLLPQGRALVRHRCTTDKYNSRHNRTVYCLVHITQLRLVSCFRSPSGWLDLWAGITRLWEVATQGEGARLTHVRGTFLLLPPSPLASWGPFCWPRWGQDKLRGCYWRYWDCWYCCLLVQVRSSSLAISLSSIGQTRDCYCLTAGHQPVLHRTS